MMGTLKRASKEARCRAEMEVMGLGVGRQSAELPVKEDNKACIQIFGSSFATSWCTLGLQE